MARVSALTLARRACARTASIRTTEPPTNSTYASTGTPTFVIAPIFDRRHEAQVAHTKDASMSTGMASPKTRAIAGEKRGESVKPDHIKTSWARSGPRKTSTVSQNVFQGRASHQRTNRGSMAYAHPVVIDHSTHAHSAEADVVMAGRQHSMAVPPVNQRAFIGRQRLIFSSS